MKKILFIICCVCGFSQAQAVGEDLKNKTEVRSAAFIPASQMFREIYGDVLPSLQIEQARGFKHPTYLEIWGNFEWIFANGNGIPSCGKSHIDIFNISIGLKSIGSVYQDWIYLYAGLGADLGITYIKNQADCCKKCHSQQHTSDWNIGVGGIAKTGCQIFVTPHFYFDIFADYLYLPIKFQNTKDIGGLKVGLGLSGRY